MSAPDKGRQTAPEPDGRTSNYGWALWHLEQAEKEFDSGLAGYHLDAARVRATLAQVDQMDDEPSGPSVWSWEE